MIQLASVVKSYFIGGSSLRVLDGISLHIKPGEMVAIMGPSGSGKSTLMNILGCLDRPDAGQYLLEGKDVSKLSKDQLAEVRSQRIGFVFQSFNLLPRVTALENVALPLLYAGNTGGSAPTERAKVALEVVGLADRMHHEPNQLSGGQRQRVAIARAIINDPAIILADEPTGNLDSKSGKEILQLFTNFHNQGRTIVVVTHDPEVAQYCSGRICLRDGRVIERKETAA
jgi:putative ABC transport system ATP-binding protein